MSSNSQNTSNIEMPHLVYSGDSFNSFTRVSDGGGEYPSSYYLSANGVKVISNWIVTQAQNAETSEECPVCQAIEYVCAYHYVSGPVPREYDEFNDTYGELMRFDTAIRRLGVTEASFENRIRNYDYIVILTHGEHVIPVNQFDNSDYSPQGLTVNANVRLLANRLVGYDPEASRTLYTALTQPMPPIPLNGAIINTGHDTLLSALKSEDKKVSGFVANMFASF